MRTLCAVCLVATLACTSGLAAQHVRAVFISSQPEPPPPLLAQIQAPPPNASGTRTPDGAVRISGGLMAGQIVKKVLPASLPCGVGGMVVTHAIVGTDGKIEKLTLMSGPTKDGYADAVMNAIRQWEYRPFLINGAPVKVDTTISFVIDRNGNGCGS